MRYLISPLLACIFFLCFSCNDEKDQTSNPESGSSTIKEDQIKIPLDSLQLHGFVAYKDSGEGKKPGILVVHEWWGLNEYAKQRARQLAELGYVAMAIDLFGNNQTAANPEEAMALAGPFYQDPQLGKTRVDAALARLRTMPQVDTSKIAAIGYCFGGSMVLNAAKLGSDVEGVVSFHGGLAGPPPSNLKAQVLVCHGEADSMVPETDSLQFRNQLDSIGAVYTFKTYQGAKHAFTNPDATANGKKFGLDIAYHPEADRQSWEDMKAFFSRIFGL